MGLYYPIGDRPSPVVKSPISPSDITAPSRPPLLTDSRGVVDTAATRQLGRYQLIRRLAVGGMAEIFLARVEGPGDFEKIVVCKRMMPECANDKRQVRMFLDEARLLARLDHPGITQVHDMGDQDGVPYFAMEFVHGEDLRTIMRAATTAGERIPDAIAAMIISEAAQALHYAHEQKDEQGRALNIVHRDVSPSNILVSYHGSVKVADFGIAKSALQQTETRVGTLKGKLSYMAPEQARGDAVDRRTDVFALGILLYELTTDTRLFQGATDMAVLKQVIHCQITPPSRRRADYPPALAAIVMRALSLAPENRYPDARSLAIALHDFARSTLAPCDSSDRETFVRHLFANKLALWHEAKQHGQTLGQHLTQMARHGTATEAASNDLGDESEPAIDEVTQAERANVPAMVPQHGPKSQGLNRNKVAILAGAALLTIGALLWRPTPQAVDSRRVEAPPTRVEASLPTVETPSPAPPVEAIPVSPGKQRPRTKGPRTNATASTPAAPSKATTQEKTRVWDPDSVLLPPK